MQAALGLAQLERINQLVSRKRQIFAWYARELEGVASVTLNAEPSNTLNSYWMITAVIDPTLGLAKEELMARLGERGIDTRPFFHPLSSIPAFRDSPQAIAAQQRNRIAYSICARGVNLPSALCLSEEQVVFACDSLKAILSTYALHRAA
jgi:perosamine synthetase